MLIIWSNGLLTKLVNHNNKYITSGIERCQRQQTCLQAGACYVLCVHLWWVISPKPSLCPPPWHIISICRKPTDNGITLSFNKTTRLCPNRLHHEINIHMEMRPSGGIRSIHSSASALCNLLSCWRSAPFNKVILSSLSALTSDRSLFFRSKEVRSILYIYIYFSKCLSITNKSIAGNLSLIYFFFLLCFVDNLYLFSIYLSHFNNFASVRATCHLEPQLCPGTKAKLFEKYGRILKCSFGGSSSALCKMLGIK